MYIGYCPSVCFFMDRIIVILLKLIYFILVISLPESSKHIPDDCSTPSTRPSTPCSLALHYLSSGTRSETITSKAQFEDFQSEPG